MRVLECAILAFTVFVLPTRSYPSSEREWFFTEPNCPDFLAVLPPGADSTSEAISVAYAGATLAPMAINPKSEELMTSQDVLNSCKISSNVHSSHSMYHRSLQWATPRKISWKAKLSVESQAEGDDLVLHALGVYQASRGVGHPYICDLDGNVYFTEFMHWRAQNSTEGVIADAVYYSRLPVPRSGQISIQSTEPFNPTKWRFEKPNNWVDYTGAYTLHLAVCNKKVNATQVTIEARISIEASFAWGNLEPIMISELMLITFLFVAQSLLFIWYYHKTKVYGEYVLIQQKVYLSIVAGSALVSFVFLVDLAEANITGSRAMCCPLPTFTAIVFLLKGTASNCFNVLLLSTAKGWGVVFGRLSRSDIVNVLIFFVILMVLFVISYVPGYSLSWTVVMSHAAVWIWYYWELRGTIRNLELSTRPDGVPKLSMYRDLLRLSHAVLLLMICLLIFLFFVFSSSQIQYLTHAIPPALVTDICWIALMIGFGWIWRPSPSTASFAYAQSYQEEQVNLSELREGVLAPA